MKSLARSLSYSALSVRDNRPSGMGYTVVDSLDLNPDDYKLLAAMQQQLYQTKVHDIHEPKQLLINM